VSIAAAAGTYQRPTRRGYGTITLEIDYNAFGVNNSLAAIGNRLVYFTLLDSDYNYITLGTTMLSGRLVPALTFATSTVPALLEVTIYLSKSDDYIHRNIQVLKPDSAHLQALQLEYKNIFLQVVGFGSDFVSAKFVDDTGELLPLGISDSIAAAYAYAELVPIRDLAYYCLFESPYSFNEAYQFYGYQSPRVVGQVYPPDAVRVLSISEALSISKYLHTQVFADLIIVDNTVFVQRGTNNIVYRN
jgi:hypothetical protein